MKLRVQRQYAAIVSKCTIFLACIAIAGLAHAGGTVTVELYDYPTSVTPGQLVDVEVRLKFSGGGGSGPWQVEDIDLSDDDDGMSWNNDDPGNIHQDIKTVDNPFYIYNEGQWYYHTFQNVNLSAYDDGGDGIELFVWAEVDDNVWNGTSPDGASDNHQVGVSPSKATNPDPSNGASGQSVSTDPSWDNGGGATSYDVYFGTDSSPDSGEYKGNQSGRSYNPGTLSYSTTYYWRIDAKNYAGTVQGTVWSFTTGNPPPPSKATNPDPSNGATSQSIYTDPSWDNGGGASSYNVYFGTDSSPDSGEYKGNQSGTSYNPGTLSYSTTYYWRIDAKNAGGTTQGSVWSFTTQQAPPSKATSPSPSNGEASAPIDGDATLSGNLAWQNGGGASSYDLYFGTDPSPDAGEFKRNQSGTSYDPGELATGQTYYWRIDAKNSSGTTQGDVWSFTTAGNSAAGPAYGNTSAQEYGDALYDHFNFATYNYNHAGIYAGIDNTGVERTFESSLNNFPEDPNEDPPKGPQEGSFQEYFVNDTGGYYGAYIPSTYSTTMPFEDRKKVVSKGKEVIDANITYPLNAASDSIDWEEGFTAPLEPGEIVSIHCGGLVEYVYERSGIRVWRNALEPDDTWNIAYHPGTHTGNAVDLTRDPHFEFSPWAQRGAPPATGPKPFFDEYSGPPWPDTRMTKVAPVRLPTVQISVVETTASYIDVRLSATDESGIFRILHTPANGGLGPDTPKVNPDRHPLSDTFTTPEIRLIRASGSNAFTLDAYAQDHGGNWCDTYRWELPFLPYKPHTPSPSHGSSDRSVSTDLSWQDGGGATSYDVYFGTDSSPDSGEFKGNQSGTTYDPGTLAYSTTYYWRIDSKNSAGTTEGDVWSFTTPLLTYTVSYNANGATSGSAPGEQAKTHDVTLTLAANSGNLVKSGYTFAGWNTAANGSGMDYAAGGSYTANASVTLYAKWTTLPTYTVSYGANGATSGTAPGSQTKTHDVTLTLAANSGNLVKSGYTFAGWNTAANGSGTDYAAGGSYTANASVTLYAKWTTLPTYTVSYSANGATSGTTPGAQTKTHDVTLTLAANSGNLTKIGYTFAGWNSASTGLGTDYAAGGSYTANASLTLYAKWIAGGIVATPTFNPDGGSHSGSSLSVTVTCATAGATIRYTVGSGTTAGDDPTEASSIVENGNVNVPVPGWLKARAWKDGMDASGVRSAVYDAEGTDVRRVALVNPDYVRVLKMGVLDEGDNFYSVASGTVPDGVAITNVPAWTDVGGHADFVYTVLTNAGFEVDVFEAADLPDYTAGVYQAVIVQDPLREYGKVFPRSSETTLPDLLEHTTNETFLGRLVQYHENGAPLVLMGDAVRLLEAGAGRLGFGKTIETYSVFNEVSEADNRLPGNWLFIRGNPFCGVDRNGSGQYLAAGGSLMAADSVIGDLTLFDGNDLPFVVIWSDSLYYPSDAVSLLDAQVTGQGDYVVSGATCNPPVYQVTVNDVVTPLAGYTVAGGRRVYFLGSDSFFDFQYRNHHGASHAGQYHEIHFTVSDEAKQALVDLVNQAIDEAVPVYERRNVALATHGGVASADSVGSYVGTTHYAADAIDGNSDSYWANSWSMPSWLRVKFDCVYPLDEVAVVWGGGAHNQTFSISLSENGADWTVVVPSRASNTDAGDEGAGYHGNTQVVREEFPISLQDARYMRIDVTDSSAPGSHIFKAIVHELQAFADTTTNGVPIVWLQAHGLPTDGSADFTCRNGNLFNVWESWRAGTDPSEPAESLRMTEAPTGSPQGLVIKWRSVASRTYRIERSSDLAGIPPFTTLATDIQGVDGVSEYADETAIGSGPFFYRVVVE